MEAEGRGLRKTTLTASVYSIKENAGCGSFYHLLTAGLCSRHWGIINQPEGAISKLKEFRAYQGRWTLTKNYTIKITIIVQHSSLEPHCLGSDLNTATKWLWLWTSDLTLFASVSSSIKWDLMIGSIYLPIYLTHRLAGRLKNICTYKLHRTVPGIQ